MTKHSDKALATLAAMNTTPDQWALTEILWVEEERQVMGQVTCPTCLGNRFVRAGGCTGKVPGLVTRAIMVGYPQFPAGARFDSRFAGPCCHLCAKRIEKSGRVPVNTTTADGTQHAMWVGEDCARKFLSVKIKRTEDSVMEDGTAT